MFRSTTSTNDIALGHAGGAGGAGERIDGLVVAADQQTAGRGRLGHRWVARPEQSLLVSVVWRASGADSPEAVVNRWTLLAGLAAAEAIEQAAATAGAALSRIAIKWPNDLLIDGKKLAGILVENAPGGGGRVGAVIGIG